MKRLFVFVALIALGFAGWQYPSYKLAQDQLALAEARVAEVISKGTNTVDLRDLTKLRRLPDNFRDIPNLEYLYLSKTDLRDLSAIAGHPTLAHLDLKFTQVTDLTPLQGLPNLRVLDLHGAWVRDLEPLASLPSLKRLDVGRTQVASLEPLTRADGLMWLSLYKSHALDGSGAHFATLTNRAALDVNGGNAYRQGYQPDFMFNSVLRLNRFRVTVGI